jgi:ABC-2 type transport system permease protein
MSRARSIWLVARRELLERGRSRGFIFSVLFTTTIIIGSFVVPVLIFGDEGPTRVGVVEPAPDRLESAITTTAAALDQDIAVVGFPDREAGETALLDNQVAALLIVPADLSTPGELAFREAADPTIQGVVGSAVAGLRVNAALEAEGVDPTAFVEAQTPPTIRALEPPEEGADARFLIANIGAVLILVGVFSFGFTVLTGVVEEKQSRVMEVVLSTVLPRDLLMGKVLGIGILGLVQLAVFVVAGFIAASFTREFELPATTPGAAVQLVVWFILGYTLYSTALGVLGALASRMEEASNASTPVTIVAMVSYFVAIFAVINDPSGPVAIAASFIPFSAPMVVPMRAALGAITPIEIVLAALVTIGAIWVLFVVGGRVYSGAALQTAGRIRLRDAWRSAGQ